MAIDLAPCKDCKDRVVEPNCHNTCKKNKTYIAELERAKEIRKQKEDSEWINYFNRAKVAEQRRKRKWK